MMQKLGNYVLAGRFQAVFVTSLLTLLGLVIPLFSYVFSGLVPAFVTLRLNAVAGMQVIIGSLLLVSVITLLVGMNPLVAVALAIGVWMPIWLCANVLRVTEDQGKCLVTAWACSLVFIILMHLLVKDLDIWWTDWLKLWVEQVFDAEQRALVEDRLLKVAPLMTAMVAAGLFVNLAATTLLGRWWQSSMFYQGGFRKEFHALKLPPVLILLAAAVFVLLLLGKAPQGSLALDILVLLLFLYFFQGLAMIHRTVAVRKMARGWLVGLYLLLLLLPQAILFLACLGMVDSALMQRLTGKRNDKSAGDD